MLSREAFQAALVAAAAGYSARDTRFYRLVDSGRCPPEVVRRYARSCYRSAHLFCATIAEMIDKAPDREARLILLENLMEEEGIFLRPERGLVVRPEKRHDTLALRFLRACGGGGEEEDPEGDGLHPTAPGRKLLAEGRWLEAIAYLLVGQELLFSDASACLLDLFRRAGMKDRDLAFFAVHVGADCKHGQEAVDLVVDRATTAAEQQACIKAAHDGARHWFDMHGSGSGLRRAA
jgi:pyrroloquinoline quinone (PQQ) biosynthesis protein C